MYRKMWRGILLWALLFAFSQRFTSAADTASPVELPPIVVAKHNAQPADGYSLSAELARNVPFNSPVEELGMLPLDLQGRSPHQAVQTDFSLRGSNFQDVAVLLDGQRINDPQTAHHNSDIPLTKEDVEKSGIVLGSTSTDAIAGALDFRHKKPEPKSAVFETSFGQYQTKSGLLSLSGKSGDISARVSVENVESKGFYTDTDFKKFTTACYSVLDLPGGAFDISLGYQEKEFGAYDFYTPGSGFLSKEWTKTFLLNTGLTLDSGEILIKPNFLWRRHFDKFMLDKTQTRSNYLNHHQTDLITPNLYLRKEIEGVGKVGIGAEYGEEHIKSTNLGTHNRTHRSVYMDDKKDLLEKLTLGFSFRVDDFESVGHHYSGSGSLTYKVSGAHAVSLGVSRNIRLPSFTELYYADPTTTGNVSLAAEKALTYQMQYAYHRDTVSLGSTVFIRQEHDTIDWVKHTRLQPRWQADNIAHAGVFGIENYAKLKINQVLGLECNYAYNNKHLRADGYLYKYGPNYARHLLNSILFLHLPFGTQSVGLTYKKKPNRDGWLLGSLRLCRNLNKNAQVFFEVTNLFNVEYQEIEGIPQPGQWMEAGLRCEW